MRSIRFVSVAAAVALVAGAAMAAAPAQAKTTTKVSGTASLPFLPSVLSSLSLNGVQFRAEPPATGTGDGSTSQTIIFPTAKAKTDGVLPLGGGMSVGASIERLYLTAPRLEYPTGAGATRGQLTFELTTLSPTAPPNLVNGARITLFNVSRLAFKNTKGTVTGKGTTWTRIDTQRITGKVYLVDDSTLLSSINTYIGTSFFTPKLPFSTLNTVIKTTVTCSTRAECK